MKRITVSGAVIATMLSTSSPVAAEDPVDPTVAAMQAQTAVITAENARIAAETARIVAETARAKAEAEALGLPSLTGKTTVDASVGKMESWILSAGTITEAATSIAAPVNSTVGDIARYSGDGRQRPVILVSSDTELEFGLAASLREEMAALQRGISAVRAHENCTPPPPSPPPPPPARGAASNTFATQGVAPGPAAAGTAAGASSVLLPFVGAVFNALKTETTISGVTIEPDSRMLINALAGQIRGAVVASEVVAGSDASDLRTGWNQLVDARNEAFACRARLAPFGERDGVKGRVAILDGAITAVDTFATRATQAQGDKPSQLVRAARLERLAKRNPLVLRISIEQAGGSLWKRDSLWTMLGFSGVRTTGGLVVSYRLSDPLAGDVYLGGALVCRTGFISMKAVHGVGELPHSCTAAGATVPPATPSGG